MESNNHVLPSPRHEILWTALFGMLIGYYGFFMSWAHEMTTSSPPEWLVMVSLLKWSLRCGAIVCGVIVVASFIAPMFAWLLNSIFGVGLAAIFVAVAVWEFTTPYFSGIPAIFLIIAAILCGYSGVHAFGAFRIWVSARQPTTFDA